MSIIAVSFSITTAGKTSYHSNNSGDLPRIGSKEKLMELLSRAEIGRYYGDELQEDVMAESGGADEKSAPGHSTTNTQVEGVGEADLVKNDGEYIYQLAGDKLVISRAYPVSKMEVVSELNFNKDFKPSELYAGNKHMVVIGNSNYSRFAEKTSAVHPPLREGKRLTKAFVYDISDKRDIKKVREVEIEGRYVSSRKVEDNIYMVANKGIRHAHIMEDIEELTGPVYRDSNSEGGFREKELEDIHYLPGSVSPNYVNVCSFNLNENQGVAEVYTYLGDGENIYASPQNLYIAAVKHNNRDYQNNQSETTAIYKFALNNGDFTYTGKGEVPGHILNQFSMDESEGYFRIATTKGQVWRSGERTSKNNLYVLDENMEITGKIEDIAPGERIYSTRFMGDRAYMVTFKKVDPLFVIDLENPEQPRILGKLKIPGYSDYLHPFDENHIIGFGKDTVAKGDTAYYQGMKLAVFDVSDVNNPIQKHTEIIGDRGTESEILKNHKALLFDREKNLLAFPVRVMEKETENSDARQYGRFSFQGAYIYNIGLERGFDLKGKITHLTDSDYRKAGDTWYDSNKNVERVIYIGENLYTLSPEMIKAHDINTLKEKNSLDI